MLYLLLRSASERYALDARRIVEVVPLVNLRPLPHAAPYVAGLFDYRGTLVPVIDLCRLLGQAPCGGFLTTRIVLIGYPDHQGGTRTLGLLAEQVTETVKLQDDAFRDPGIEVPEAPYLGAVIRINEQLIQRIDIDGLLPDDLRNQLFTECA